MVFMLTISLAAHAYANPLESPFEVEIFYLDGGGGVCAACPGDFAIERELAASVNSVFRHGINSGQIVFRYYNLHRSDDFSLQLSERAYLAGLDLESAEMPVFFTQDNLYFYGDQAIEMLMYHAENLGIDLSVEAFEEIDGIPSSGTTPYMPEGVVVSPRSDDPYNLTANDSVVIYFYVPWCPSCYEIAPIMDNMPEYVMLDGRPSYVRLISLNRDIPEHHDIIRKYHEKLNIPDERRFVPLVLIGDRDLFLYEEVSRYLLPALEAGEGLHTPLFTERQPEPVPVLNQMALPLVLLIAIGSASLYYWFGKKRGEKHA